MSGDESLVKGEVDCSKGPLQAGIDLADSICWPVISMMLAKQGPAFAGELALGLLSRVAAALVVTQGRELASKALHTVGDIVARVPEERTTADAVRKAVH